MNTGSGKKIKLLVITPSLECGGAEKYVAMLCNHINTQRFKITLVIIDNEHPFYTITNNDVDVVGLGLKHVRSSLFAIRRMINQQQPDIVYTVANHLNLLLATFRWMFPKKNLFIARESSIASINSRRAKFPELYTRLLKKFYNRFDLIICQSAYMQQDLITHFNIPENKTALIHNTVEDVSLQAKAITSAPGTYQFITVARLSAEKGIDRLIRAVASVKHPFRYYIIGEGDQRKQLQALIDKLHLQDKVILTGEKLNPYNDMGNADLFLMGSHYEGFPNVLLEAGILGIPAIAFDVPGGTPEIISDGLNGLLVKDGDETAFTAAIEKALSMNFNRQGIIAAAKKRYSINVIIPQTEHLLISLLSARE